jgi:hypothetical protein
VITELVFLHVKLNQNFLPSFFLAAAAAAATSSSSSICGLFVCVKMSLDF